MASSKVAAPASDLQRSLKQLTAITNTAYNDQIRHVALNIWQKHLNPDNPQWRYLTRKSFYISNKSGSAHVMAMIDSRLPQHGIVGYFACTNSAVGAEVLTEACAWLKKEHNLHDVYGPINGTLPNDYRLNVDDDYVFPGEPVNPRWHIDAFREAGFNIFNRYASGKLKYYQILLKFALRKPHKDFAHLTVRPFNNSDYDQDFKIYHELRNQIFPFQSTYCPAISLEERIYNSSGKFDPAYTYFLNDSGKDIGFVMAYPYKNQLVLKTIGLLPAYRGKRLTSLLLDPIHKQAARDQLHTSIYGMVRVGNRVYKNKHPMAKVFRNYVTMHKHS